MSGEPAFELYRGYRIRVERGARLRGLIYPPGWTRPLDDNVTATEREGEASLLEKAYALIDADLRGSRR